MLRVTEKIEHVNVKADTVKEFMRGASQKFGGTSLGVTTYEPDYDYTYNKTNTIASATITLALKTREPKWVKGSKTPDRATIHAIAQIVTLAVCHEQKHRATYKQTFLKSAVDKAVIAKPDDQAAGKVLDDLKIKLDKACEALHSKEGKIKVVETNGNFSVTMAAAGSGGCK